MLSLVQLRRSEHRSKGVSDAAVSHAVLVRAPLQMRWRAMLDICEWRAIRTSSTWASCCSGCAQRMSVVVVRHGVQPKATELAHLRRARAIDDDRAPGCQLLIPIGRPAGVTEVLGAWGGLRVNAVEGSGTLAEPCLFGRNRPRSSDLWLPSKLGGERRCLHVGKPDAVSTRFFCSIEAVVRERQHLLS